MIIRSRKDTRYVPKGTHTKYININGEFVPSVTNVIKVIPKDALIYWANSLGWKKKSVKRELEESAYIGTIAHNTIEKIIIKDKQEGVFNADKLRECMYKHSSLEVQNSVLSFISWYEINRNDIELIDIERKMVNLSYGGTCDMICKYKNKPMIFDFKTSGDFYFSMFVQLSAYVKLYERETDTEIEDVAVLRVDKKDGEIAQLKRLSEVRNGDIDYYYSVFEQCLDLYYSLYVLENDWK